MGTFLFIIIVVALLYWRIFIFGSFSRVISSKRQPVPIGARQAPMPVEPIVTPVAEINKIPERLPQVELDFVTIVESTPMIDREVLPNFSTPPSKIEESLLYRTLILVLFTIAAISVDLAAGTQYAWMGIPMTTIGSIWSWYRRHHAKHWLNILLSVVSLGLVFGIFAPLLFKQIPPAIDRIAPSGKLAATLELTLGAVVIALQMGLSFHLYSRRILGYCLLTSIILIGVAAGFSQNIGFLILLCGFMTIAIPTLMLDYRSRLSLKPVGIVLETEQNQLSYQHLPWKYLHQLAAISIGLGLILSIFLPNFHFPDLSLKQAGIEQLQNLAQKYHNPNSNSQSSSTPSNPPPPVNQQELASKVFGQPGNNNYPDSIKQENLQLPPELTSQLQQFTHQILATSPQPLNSDFDRSTYLAEYLKQHHQDSAPSSTLPPLDSKLIQELIAQCTTEPQTCKMVGNKQDLPVVYTSMLRSISIPARLKTDDKLAQIDPQTNLYPRPAAQSASQPEMYSPNWGWVQLDATPDRPVINLTPQQQEQLQAQLQQQAPPTPSPSAAATSPTSPNNSQSQPELHNHHPAPVESPKWDPNPAILKTIAMIILIACGIALFLQRHHHEQQQLATLPPIERIYRSMIGSLSQTGNAKVPAQTQLEYARSIKNTEHPQIAKVVAEISQLYTAWRYGNQHIDTNQLQRKFQNLQHLQQLAANRKRQQWFKNQQALFLSKR